MPRNKTQLTAIDAGASADIGAVADAAVTDPTAEASIISSLKGIIKQLQGDGSGASPVSDAGGALSIDIGGVVPGLDNTNEIKASIYGKNAAAGDTPVLVDASGNVMVSLATTLSSSTDSIDVDKMSKGSVTTAHDAIESTATSSEIDCRGYNAISVECAVSAITSGNWLIEVLGCAVTGGTFGNCYAPKSDGTFFQQKTLVLDADGNYTFYFTGIPNYVKIKATRTTDGTLTCKVTSMNL